MSTVNESQLRQDIRRLYVETCEAVGKNPMRLHEFEDAMRSETASFTDEAGTIDGGDLKDAVARVVKATP